MKRILALVLAVAGLSMGASGLNGFPYGFPVASTSISSLCATVGCLGTGPLIRYSALDSAIQTITTDSIAFLLGRNNSWTGTNAFTQTLTGAASNWSGRGYYSMGDGSNALSFNNPGSNFLMNVRATNLGGHNTLEFGHGTSQTGWTTTDFYIQSNGDVGVPGILRLTANAQAMAFTPTTGTAALYGAFTSTGASGYFGAEGSAGGQVLGGTHPYAFVWGTGNNTAADFCTANTLRLSIAGGGGVTVTSLAGTGSRAVVADANGLLSAP